MCLAGYKRSLFKSFYITRNGHSIFRLPPTRDKTIVVTATIKFAHSIFFEAQNITKFMESKLLKAISIRIVQSMAPPCPYQLFQKRPQ